MKKLVFLQVIYGILTISLLGLLLVYLFTDLVNLYGWIGWFWTVFASLMLGVENKKKELISVLKLCFAAAAQDEKIDDKELEYLKSLSKKLGVSDSDIQQILIESTSGQVTFLIPEKDKVRKKMLKHVAEIIKIDGKVTDKEREFIFTLAEKLKLSKSDAEALL